MNDRRLVRHLSLAVGVKLALLAGLWWLFVREAQPRLDPARVAARVVSPSGTALAAPTPSASE